VQSLKKDFSFGALGSFDYDFTLNDFFIKIIFNDTLRYSREI
jgi:hypothetical protein